MSSDALEVVSRPIKLTPRPGSARGSRPSTPLLAAVSAPSGISLPPSGLSIDTEVVRLRAQQISGPPSVRVSTAPPPSIGVSEDAPTDNRAASDGGTSGAGVPATIGSGTQPPAGSVPPGLSEHETSLWYLRQYHAAEDMNAIPYKPGPQLTGEGESQLSEDEPTWQKHDVNPDGTRRVYPDTREASLLHYADHFRSSLRAHSPPPAFAPRPDQLHPRAHAHSMSVPSSPARPMMHSPGVARTSTSSGPGPSHVTFEPLTSPAAMRRPASAGGAHHVHGPPLREPEAFAREMVAMRQRYQGEHLTPAQRDRLTIEAYDGFLGELRRQEQMLLMKRRQAELDRVRGPADSWWEIKDTRFAGEMRRHRAGLQGRLNTELLDQLVHSPL